MFSRWRHRLAYRKLVSMQRRDPDLMNVVMAQVCDANPNRLWAMCSRLRAAIEQRQGKSSRRLESRNERRERGTSGPARPYSTRNALRATQEEEVEGLDISLHGEAIQ